MTVVDAQVATATLLCLTADCDGEATAARGWGRYCRACRRAKMGLDPVAPRRSYAQGDVVRAARRLVLAAEHFEAARRRQRAAEAATRRAADEYLAAVRALPGFRLAVSRRK